MSFIHDTDDEAEDLADIDLELDGEYTPLPALSKPKALAREPLFQTLFRQSIDPGNAVLRDFADFVVGPLSTHFALKSAKGGDFFRMKEADGAPKADRYSRDQTLRGHLINGMLPAQHIARLLAEWGAKPLRDWDERAERLFIAGYMLHDFLKIEDAQEKLKAAGFVDYFAMSSPSEAQIPVLETIFYEWSRTLGLESFLAPVAELETWLHHLIFVACNTQVRSGTMNNPRMLPNIPPEDVDLVDSARHVSRLADLLAYVAPTPREMVSGDIGGEIRKLITCTLGSDSRNVIPVAQLTYHHVAENRGLLLNLIHNAALDTLSTETRRPLLYAPSGVVYLERHDSPPMPAPGKLVQSIVDGIRRKAGNRLIETGKGAKRGNTFLQIDESYNDFFSLPEMIRSAPTLIARYIKNNKSPERLENTRKRGVADIPTVSTEPKDARADQIAEWASLIERLYRDRMGQDISAKLLELLEIGDLRESFNTVKQTVGAAGGVPLAWYWAAAHKITRQVMRDDETLALLETLSEKLAASLPEDLPEPAQVNQATWDDLGDYLARMLTLGGEKDRTGLRDELQAYTRAKGRSGTICAVCGSDYMTRKPKESAISFQPGVYTGRLAIGKGENTRPLCSICALEQLLRQLFMENLDTGSTAEGQRIRYLSFYPSYYFTPETLRLMQQAIMRIRDVRISDKELMSLFRDTDLTDTVFWQRLEDFVAPRQGEPSKRVLRYQQDVQATFLTLGLRSFDAKTETEAWIQPAFLALVLSVCLDVKIVASDSGVPMLLESAELPETIWFDGAHPSIQALIGGSRLRNDDIRMALARLVAAYMIHLDAEYVPPKENWNRFGPIAHSLMESPMYVFHHLKRQQRHDGPLSAAQLSRYIHFAETLFTINDKGVLQMNHARTLVRLYRGFYRAKNIRSAYSILRPLDVIAGTLLITDLKTYPDRESLVDAARAGLMSFIKRVESGKADGRFPKGVLRSERETAMIEFSRYFVENLFIDLYQRDTSALQGRKFNLLRDTCEMIYREMHAAEWAEQGRDADTDEDGDTE